MNRTLNNNSSKRKTSKPRPSKRELLNQTLERFIKENGASSCTFYIRDPFWPRELRLIAMLGVKYPEPMHGFSFPPHPSKVLTEGEPEIFSSDSRLNPQLREEVKEKFDGIPENKKFLFGDFVQREGVRSSARLIHKVAKEVRAVLFVNFVKAQEFNDLLKHRLTTLFSELIKNLPDLETEVSKSESASLAQVIRMFPPTSAAEWEHSVEKSFDSLLEIAKEALGLKNQTTLGMIHIYDPRTRTLKLQSKEELEDPKLGNVLSITKGQGVISWVAIRRKALLISDLKKSPLGKKIHLPTKTKVRSEVAIPIFAGEELLGVLTLESFRANAFEPSCVRSLWFAVNRAAVAYRLSQQARISMRLKELNDGLLNLCAECADQGTGNFSLDKLATLATKHLDSTRCDIWRYESGRFHLAGKSYSDFEPDPPRPGGWSDEVRISGSPVWIHARRSNKNFKRSIWQDSIWVEQPLDKNSPQMLNETKQRIRVKSRLAIPIKVRRQCIGVAWLENDHSQEEAPSGEFMKLALGFAAHAGLVIEFSQVDLVDKNQVQMIGQTLSETLLNSGPLKQYLEKFPVLEAYARTEPFPNSTIGGDFFAARVIEDGRSAGVLVGDGQGHAVNGALNMLPLLAVFEAFWKTSRSTSHIMDKILDTSNKLGVRGTAIYCVFNLVKEKKDKETLWLSVSNAGHPLPIIFRKDKTSYFPEKSDASSDGGMLGVMLTMPLVEHRTPLSSGDLIILMTDGLDLEFDELAGAVGSIKNGSNERIANSIFKKALDKRAGKSIDDDQTVLVIRVMDPDQAPADGTIPLLPEPASRLK
jgi:GAF domain-containing protein